MEQTEKRETNRKEQRYKTETTERGTVTKEGNR